MAKLHHSVLIAQSFSNLASTVRGRPSQQDPVSGDHLTKYSLEDLQKNPSYRATPLDIKATVKLK